MRSFLITVILVILSHQEVLSLSNSKISTTEAVSTNFASISSVDNIIKFPLQDTTKAISLSLMLTDGNNDLLLFWVESDSLFYGRSTDMGETWSGKYFVKALTGIWSSDLQLSGIVSSSGRILLGYKKNEYVYSDDNGHTWSESISLPNYQNGYSFSVGTDNRIWLVFGSGSYLRYRESTDNGLNFSTPKVFWNNSSLSTPHGNIIQLNDSTLFSTTAFGQIYGKFSYDNGESWDEPLLLSGDSFVSNLSQSLISTIKTGDSTIVIIYGDKNTSDIEFIKSYDRGSNWSNPISFTKYVGFDGYPSATLINEKVISCFQSTRFDKQQIWYGTVEESDDIESPPVIVSISPMSGTFIADSIFILQTEVIDESEILSVFATPYSNEVELSSVQLFDDGFHNDNNANDNIYGNSFPGFSVNERVKFKVEAIDDQSLTAVKWTSTFSFNHVFRRKEVLIDVNNFLLPINNRGILADERMQFPDGTTGTGAKFEESGIMYSGGFALSGERYYHLWANGNMSSSSIEDYVPGNVPEYLSYVQDDSLKMIYVIRKSDIPFGPSWQEWKNAVMMGANYYDGDNDGLYNPIDFNGNGEWDSNEDRPDLIGDMTAWCVVNDGVNPSSRYFSNMEPLGIEIKQTVFAYSKDSFPELANTVFVRYNIENMNGVTQQLDSVYFSAWADGDLGYFRDDMIGTDRNLNSIYLYNDGADDEYGDNPPSLFLTILQGPQAYIPGETFSDANQNGRYDEGVDSSITEASLNRGQYLNPEIYTGAKNLNISSGIAYNSYNEDLTDPDNEIQLRNYMLGLTPQGNFFDPCDTELGEVINEDCTTIDPLFWFSGDPEENKGWLDTFPFDKRYLLSSGPFSLDTEPIEIIVAYSIGRGIDAVNSIGVAREVVKDVTGFYNTNFSHVPVGVAEEQIKTIPTKLYLSQNYPNPFNPSTTIQYSIPVVEALSFTLSGAEAGVEGLNQNSTELNVTLKVYDILGREIATLVNEHKKSGSYEINFNASNLSSGVYFYTLQSGSFRDTKKMMLLR